MGLETVAQNYSTDNRLSIMQNLDGINQPYSCDMWAVFGGIESYNLVDDGDGYEMHNLFSINGNWHAVAIIDQNMEFRYFTDSPNAETIIDIIEVILSETDWFMGDVNLDQNADILDVITLVNNILDESYNYLSDINYDEVVNIQDVILLIQIILEL